MGNWQRLLSDTQWRDTEVQHDCRFSVAMWLEPGHHKALDAFFGLSVEKRCEGGIELLAWQSRKDGEAVEGPHVIVAHTPPGARGNKQQAEPRIIDNACRLLQLPKRAVTSSKIITWFQSQVLSKTSKEPCLVACQQPPLIMAGDYLTASTFTGCVQSATAAADMASLLLDPSSLRGPSKENGGAFESMETKHAPKRERESDGYDTNLAMGA